MVWIRAWLAPPCGKKPEIVCSGAAQFQEMISVGGNVGMAVWGQRWERMSVTTTVVLRGCQKRVDDFGGEGGCGLVPFFLFFFFLKCGITGVFQGFFSVNLPVWKFPHMSVWVVIVIASIGCLCSLLRPRDLYQREFTWYCRVFFFLMGHF